MIEFRKLKTFKYSHIAASFVLIFAHLIFITAFFPAGWNWGFHFLAFYRIEIIILIPFLMLLFIFPSVQDFFIDRIFSFGQWFYKKPRALRVTITLAALGGIVLLFWIFRVRTYFLGDGQLVLRSIQNINSADALAIDYKREPLIGFCIVLLAKFFIALKRSNPAGDAYCWLSILSGVVFVITAWRFVKQYAEEKIEQHILFILLITTGVSQLFFGYVENYAPSAAGILLFLLLGVAYLRGKISIVWVMVVYGIVLLLHFGVLIFLPSFAFLSYIAVKRKQAGELIASLFLTGTVSFVLLQLSMYPFELLEDVLGSTGHHIVAFSLPFNKYQAYDFFSVSHILDIANFFLVSYPAVVTLLILSSIMIWRKRITITIETIFLLIAALCGVIFIFILNCEIGMSRDWDILAPISLGMPTAAIALWITIKYEGKYGHRILLMFCVISLLQTGLWIGVNADENKAEERFKILEDDHLWSKHAHLDAYEELAVYYRERGDYEKAIQYYQNYISLDSTNKRLWGNLANAYQSAGQKKKAEEVYLTMIHLDMANYQILSNLGVIYIEEKRFAEAMIMFKQAEEDAPKDPIIKYNIGIIIMEGEQAYKKAIPYFMDAIHFDSTFFPAYYSALECYSQLGDSIQAEQLLTRLKGLSRNYNIR